jgi:hypothetical protein
VTVKPDVELAVIAFEWTTLSRISVIGATVDALVAP